MSLPIATAVTLCAIFLFAALAIPFGLTTTVLVWAPTAKGLWFTAAIALFIPCIAEELIFRGPLIRWGSWRSAICLLTAYVIWHPVAAITFLDHGRPLFWDPAFLVIVSAFGVTATALTLLTKRLAPAIIAHWVLVVAWKQLFSGPALIGGPA